MLTVADKGGGGGGSQQKYLNFGENCFKSSGPITMRVIYSSKRLVLSWIR